MTEMLDIRPGDSVHVQSDRPTTALEGQHERLIMLSNELEAIRDRLHGLRRKF